MSSPPPPVAYDESPRPRVLLSGLTGRNGLKDLLEGLVPTWQHMPSFGLGQLRAASWDAVFSLDAPHGGDNEFFVLQFGGTPHGSYRAAATPQQFVTFRPMPTDGVWGKEVVLPAEAPEGWRDEIKRSLIPAIRQSESPRLVIKKYAAKHVDVYVPLVTDADGAAFAAIYRPAVGAAEVIYLPACCEPSRAWIALALERWAEERPDIFPAKADWTTHPAWMSPGEFAAAAKIITAKQELDDVSARLTKAVEDAEAELDAERLKADGADRLILTGTGDELASAVAAVLRDIGFDVEERDAIGLPEKLEDLRVRTTNFVAIAEVKGYVKGGSSSDLMKLFRFVKLFVKETGHFPDARWYIVNQFRGSDPATRPQLLVNQDSTVEEFGNDDGLAVDTRCLFHLRRDVTNGTLSAEDARKKLIEARGRFAYPEEPDSAVDAESGDGS
jgi:hypothetical protein